MNKLYILKFSIRRSLNSLTQMSTSKVVTKDESSPNEYWKDPYKYALPEKKCTLTDFREADVNWSYVERLIPRKIVPDMPRMDGAVSPSGWRAPRETPPNLPYYIRRDINHMPAIYLETRRDELNPKTMDFEYVELVTLKNIEGDIFACVRDLQKYLELRLGHPVATHVDELKGLVKVKGADRTLIEQFVYDYETEFSLSKLNKNEQ